MKKFSLTIPTVVFIIIIGWSFGVDYTERYEGTGGFVLCAFFGFGFTCWAQFLLSSD